jgi:hypothetical protein
MNKNLNRQNIELQWGAGTEIETVPPVQQADTLLSVLRRTLPMSDQYRSSFFPIVNVNIFEIPEFDLRIYYPILDMIRATSKCCMNRIE